MPTRAWPTRTQGANKGPAHKGQSRPTRAQGGPQGPRPRPLKGTGPSPGRAQGVIHHPPPPSLHVCFMVHIQGTVFVIQLKLFRRKTTNFESNYKYSYIYIYTYTQGGDGSFYANPPFLVYLRPITAQAHQCPDAHKGPAHKGPAHKGLAHKGPGAPQGPCPQGPGPRGPRAPTRARSQGPRGAHKGPGLDS